MNTTKKISATFRVLPPGVPARLWLVLHDGKHYFMYKEPLEGWVVWTLRSDATVIEYPFGAVIYTPPPKKTVPPKP